MIDDKLLATYEKQVAMAIELEQTKRIAISADEPAELIEIIRNARRYLALRSVRFAPVHECSIKASVAEYDAAADRLLEGGE